jgi:hypothetical protein
MNSNGLKRRSIVTISVIILIICTFFAGSIGFIELLYRYYNELAESLECVALRRPYLTLQLLLLREVLLLRQSEDELDFRKYHSLSRGLEAQIQTFLLRSTTLLQKFADVNKELDSERFCEHFKPKFTAEVYSACNTFMQGTMKRGMKANIFQILTNLESLLNMYTQGVELGQDTAKLIHQDKYDFCGTFELC